MADFAFVCGVLVLSYMVVISSAYRHGRHEHGPTDYDPVYSSQEYFDYPHQKTDPPRTNKPTIAAPRMSERSISISRTIKKVQVLEHEITARVNPIPWIENGTSRIVNQRHSNAVRGKESIVFPGPTTRLVPKRSLAPKDVPEICKTEGICENVPDYPEDRIAELLEKSGQKTEFRIDELEMPDLSQRIGVPDETELCDFTLKIALPKAALDVNDTWQYIVNRNDKPLQGVRVEICSPKKTCNRLADFRQGYVARCKQKYILRQLKSISSDGETIVDRSFKIPSCCSCVVSPVDD